MGLKVPVDVLNHIEQECGANLDTKYKRKVCDYWLIYYPNDTWREVIVTLRRTGCTKNIRELTQKITFKQNGKN